MADGAVDHGRAGDDVAGGEHVRHGGLERGGIGLERAVAVGLEAERLGVGTHARGDDDEVAVECIPLALVVFGVEAAVGVEHAGADLDLGALDDVVALEVVDAPAVVQSDALGPSFFDLEVVGRHLLAGLEADLIDGRGAEAARGARRVDGDVAAADDQHALAGHVDGLTQLDGAQELERGLHALQFLAGHAQTDRLVRARRHEDGVETVVLEPRDIVHARVGRDLDADRRHVGDVVVDHVVRQPVRRDAEAEHATRLRSRLEDLDAVALASELPGGREAGRARAHDGDLLAVLLGLLQRLQFVLPVVPVGDEPLQAADRQRTLELAARALLLARRIARASERAHERGRLEHQAEGLLILSAAHARDVPVRLDAGGALIGARRDAGPVDHGLLRHGLRERDVGRAPRHHVGVELVGYGHVAGHLALAAAGAGGLVDELRLLRDLGVVGAVAVVADALDLGVGEDVDIGVVDGGSHLGGGDAAGAVEGGEDLAEQDHLAADAGVLLDDEDLVAHVAELES